MKKNKMVTMHIIALLLLLVGLAVTTASAVLMVTHAIKSKEYVDATAVVVDHKAKGNGLKAIIIEYNVDNKYYRLTSKHYTKKPESVSTKVKIKYNPDNHSEIIWVDNNHNHKYLASGIILLVGDIFIWIILKFVGKKKVALEPTEPQLQIEGDKPVIEEPTMELPIPAVEVKATPEIKQEEVAPTEQPIEPKEEIELPIIKEEPVSVPIEEPVPTPAIEEYDESIPLFEKEEVPAIFTPLTEEEKKNIVEKPKEEKVELPIVEEKEPTMELPVVTEEKPKLNIPEIPYDLDSPREAVVSSVMETTIAIPTLNKELIELPATKEEKNIKINNSIKSDALSKLLDDIENKK